jgi:hypothetical protein
MDLLFEEIKLHNPGVLKTRIPVSVYAELRQDLGAAIENGAEPFNTGLAGNIETELRYSPCESFKRCLGAMFEDYTYRFNYHHGKPYILEDMAWVNIQKKHEFNPVHWHYGTVSWVTYINIPYSLEEELNQPHVVNSIFQCASMFQFVYNMLDGGISMHNLQIDNTWEGVIIMFPSYLKHQVYPFSTSDETRVSIAGNIRVEGVKDVDYSY